MHALDYKKGRLVTSSYDELCDGVADLTRKTLTPTHLSSDPYIDPGCAVQSGRALLAGSLLPQNPPGTAVYSKQKGDLLIQEMWSKGTNCILYMWVVNTDVASCMIKLQKKILLTAERDKRCGYLDACFQQRQRFSICFLSG